MKAHATVRRMVDRPDLFSVLLIIHQNSSIYGREKLWNGKTVREII